MIQRTRWQVIVRPHPDEADRVTPEQIDAGRAWLADRQAEGVIAEDPRCWAETGGDVVLYADTEEQALAVFADYPLGPTVDLEPHRLVELDTGFNTLRGWQRERARVHA